MWCMYIIFICIVKKHALNWPSCALNVSHIGWASRKVEHYLKSSFLKVYWMHAGQISSGYMCALSNRNRCLCGCEKKVVGPLKLLNILPCLLSSTKTPNKRSAFQLRGSPPTPPLPRRLLSHAGLRNGSLWRQTPRPIRSFCLSLPPPPPPPPLLTTGWKDDLKLLLKAVTFK